MCRRSDARAAARELPADAPVHLRLSYLHMRDGRLAAASSAGPLAWVHWNDEESKLTLVRDRMGLEVLYYRELSTGAVAVSDHVDVLAGLGPESSPLNKRTLAAHLNGRPPSPGETCFEVVRAVPPGSIVTIDVNSVACEKYWHPETTPELRLRTDADYAGLYRELLRRVVADYAPVGMAGVTLSGGLDSSSVAAALVQAGRGEDLEAISLCAPELPAADETEASAMVASTLGLRQTSLRADLMWPCASEEAIRTKSDCPVAFFYDDSWMAMVAWAREVGAAVLLAGIGGDELFGGNVFPYVDHALSRQWTALRAQLGVHLRRLRPQTGAARAVWGLLVRPALERAGVMSTSRRDNSSVPWLGAGLREQWRAQVSGAVPEGGRMPARRQRAILVRDGALTHAARHFRSLAAGGGIDLRLPLLDHEIVEFALSLPPDQAIRGGVRKFVVRNAMRGWLPDAVLDRTDKTYPGAIAERGLKEKAVARVWSYLTNMRAADMGLVDEPRLRQEYQAYLDGKTRSSLFWHAITLEDWLRRYC